MSMSVSLSLLVRSLPSLMNAQATCPVLSTALISTRFCFATVHQGETLLSQAGYMLGFATHFKFSML